MRARSQPVPRLLLPALLLLLLVTRAWFLLGSIEEMAVNDDLVTGVTSSWLAGARILGPDALWIPHVGGDAIYQCLAVPIYALLGDTILAPKLLALLTVCIGLVVVFRVAAHHGGPRAALWAGLLYTLVPPGFMAIQIVGVGDHYVVAVTAVLAGHLLLLALRTEDPRRQARLLLALGVLVGLTTFASFLNVITWAALTPLLLLVRPRAGWRWRAVATGLAGLALGLAPLVANQLWHGAEGTMIYERSLADQVGMGPAQALCKGAALLFVDLSRASWYRLDLPGQLARHAWFGLAWAGLLACAWWQRGVVAGAVLAPLRRRRLDPDDAGITSYLLLVVLAFLGVWSLADFHFEPSRPFGYRYLVVLLPPLLLFGAIALARLGDRWPRAAVVVGAIPLLAGLVGLGWPANLHDPGRVLRFPGVTWSNHDMRAYARWKGDLAGQLALAAPQLEVEQRAGFLVALGAHIARMEGNGAAIRAGRDGLDPEDRTHLYRGVLKDLVKDGHSPPEGALRQLHSLAQQVPAASRPLFLRRLSGAVAGWESHPDTLHAWLLGRKAQGDAAWIAPLVAESWGGALVGSAPLSVATARIPELDDPALQERAWFGAGYRTALGHQPGFDWIEGALASLPEAGRAPFLDGCARGTRGWRGPAEDPAPWIRQAAALPDELAEPLLRQLGTAAVSKVDPSPYRTADALGGALPVGAWGPSCEGVGFGAGQFAKTLSDSLRWRIHWDRFVGPGCSAAFDAGLERSLQDNYGHAPGFLVQRRARLGLPAKIAPPTPSEPLEVQPPALPADFPLSPVSWGGLGGAGSGATCRPITHHPVIMVHDDGEGPEAWWRGPDGGTAGALVRAGFDPCEIWAVQLGVTDQPMRSVEELTDDLAFFMGSVLAYTDAPRVQLLARGTGAVLAHATIAKYRLHPQVHAAVYLDAPFQGLGPCDDARCFAGEVRCCSLQPGSLLLRRITTPVQAPLALGATGGHLRYLALGSTPAGIGGWSLAGAANHSLPGLATTPVHLLGPAWSLVLEALQDPAVACQSEHDGDGDGYCDQAMGGADCDDGDPTVHPGAEEREADGVDQDCNGHEVDRRFPGWACERPMDPQAAEAPPPGGRDLPAELRLLMLFESADGDMGAALERCQRGDMRREPTPDRHPHAPPTGAHYVDLGFMAPSELDQPWRGLLGEMQRDHNSCALVQTASGAAVLLAAQGSPPPPER
jgi:hypothetical protein